MSLLWKKDVISFFFLRDNQVVTTLLSYPSFPTNFEYYSVTLDFHTCWISFWIQWLCSLKFIINHCTNSILSQFLQHNNQSWYIIGQVFLPCSTVLLITRVLLSPVNLRSLGSLKTRTIKILVESHWIYRFSCEDLIIIS